MAKLYSQSIVGDCKARWAPHATAPSVSFLRIFLPTAIVFVEHHKLRLQVANAQAMHVILSNEVNANQNTQPLDRVSLRWQRLLLIMLSLKGHFLCLKRAWSGIN